MFGIDAFTYNAEWLKSAQDTRGPGRRIEKPIENVGATDDKSTHDEGPEEPWS